LAKIAVEFPLRPGPSRGRAHPGPARRVLARGFGWCVSDVICAAGPHDRPFEEQLSDACVAIVLEGSFQYRAGAGRELMTPGSLLLGNAGQYFACGHEHGLGDRCVSFSYDRQHLEALAAEAALPERTATFKILRVPPVRELSSVIARACAGLAGLDGSASVRGQSAFPAEGHPVAKHSLEHGRNSGTPLTEWEEIGLELAARALEMSSGREPNRGSLPAAEARVTRIVRMLESHPEEHHALGALAREVKLSRYHFLRVFRELTGLTPHQYVLRARLRRAATRLTLEPGRVLDIALDCGFGDVSNFNHAFRAEFGVSPGSFRRITRHGATADL
jgi:AraC family transcriptional regulator